MGRRLSVGSNNRPAVVELIDFFCAEIDHRLNRNYQPFLNFLSAAAFSIVWHLRIFVHRLTKTVAYEFPYYSVAMFFGVFLNGRTNITDSTAGACFSDSKV